jgi:hypothetical protein
MDLLLGGFPRGRRPVRLAGSGVAGEPRECTAGDLDPDPVALPEPVRRAEADSPAFTAALSEAERAAGPA